MLLKPRLWLVVLVVAILALATFFALPNIYDSQPTVEVSKEFDADEQARVLKQFERLVNKALENESIIRQTIYSDLAADELIPSTAPSVKTITTKADRLVVEFDERNNIPSVGQMSALMAAIIARRGRGLPDARIAKSQVSNELILFPDYSQFAIEAASKILDEQGIAYLKTERTASAGRVRFENTQLQSQAVQALKSLQDYSVSLNVVPGTPDWLKSLGGEPMALGLDLRGGLSILYEVAIDTAYDKRRADAMREIKNVLREAKIRFQAGDINDGVIRIPLRKAAELQAAKDLIAAEVDSVQVALTDNAGELAYTVRDDVLEESRRLAMEKNLNTMRKRIEELNIAEAVVQQQGQLRIQVDLPGVDDRSQVDNITASNAEISYHAVYNDRNPAHFSAAVNASQSGITPSGTELIYSRVGDPALIMAEPIVTGEDLIDASAGIDQDTAGPQVSVQLSTSGGFKMSQWTGKNVDNLMAVKFKDTQIVGRDRNNKPILETTSNVISIATIQGQFSTNFQTTGLDSSAEAQRLALLLRSGSLAAPVFIISENSVSATLGADNIQQGVYAVILGFLLVVAFMLFYYRGFGLVANIALIANLVLVVGVMSLPFVPATMTLPGIAGLVLTVGMAVDANVLIFERIREELRVGMTSQAAIVSGYQRALVTIADANITTFLTAAILYFVGTGPVKGFATTLGIGILASMFTAIVLTRVIIALFYGGNKRVKKLSI